MEPLSRFTKIIIFILVLSILINLCLFCRSSMTFQTTGEDSQEGGYSLIDPVIAEMEMNEFIQTKHEYISSYVPLRHNLEEFLVKQGGHYGIYFEDLYSHSWMGINERERFKPASLLKTTTVSSILSMAEEKEIGLDTLVVLGQDDLNERFGELYREEGSKITIKRLIEIALMKSDNTAVKALHKFISEEKWIETRLAMGLPLVSVQESENGTLLSPKEFSRIFHSLYHAGYLSRESSNWVLSLLSQTDFQEGIPSGVPDDVKVSHKIGVWASAGDVHDCGIVYANRPYLLCIMSSGVTQEEGTNSIKEISHMVYKYVSDN